MKIRRMLATAVAAAVTTPVLLLSAGPAFAADPTSPAQVQDQKQKQKPTKDELEKLAKKAAEAQKAYDDAVAAEALAQAAVDALAGDKAPLVLALAEAKKAADTAATAKTTADTAVTEAQAALDELTAPGKTPQPGEVEKAGQTLSDAKAAAVTASEAKDSADGKLKEAAKALDDARVSASRDLASATAATANAKTDKDLADKALKKAQDEAAQPDPDPSDPADPSDPPTDPTDPTDPPTTPGDEDCDYDAALSTTLVGLPSKVVAGTTVNFTLHVTNGTDKELDKVKPFAAVYDGTENSHGDLNQELRIQSAPAGSNDWKNVGEAEFAGTITHLKAGASADLKLRFTVDKKTPASSGLAFVAGNYWNENGSCGGNDMKEYKFSILAAGSDPGRNPDSTPTPVKDAGQVPIPLGGTSTTPVSTGTTGNLASTGANGTTQLALAAGTAVVLGAGAVLVVRRRKTDEQG